MNYLWTNGRLAIPAPAGLLVFIFKSLHSAVTEVENKENTSIHQPRVCTFTQLHAALFNFVETSTQMMTLLMLSKIASIINCLFISCEIVSLIHDDRASVEEDILQEGRGSSPWSSWSVYVHFVWGGPAALQFLQLLKKFLHVSLLWTARQDFCQGGIVHILMGETVNSEIIN